MPNDVLGHVREEIGGTPGESKIDISSVKNMRVESRIYGRQNLAGKNDDQFIMLAGNVLVLSDDQSPYPSLVHRGSSHAEVTGRRPDNVDLATVNAASAIVRPVGGATSSSIVYDKVRNRIHSAN